MASRITAKGKVPKAFAISSDIDDDIGKVPQGFNGVEGSPPGSEAVLAFRHIGSLLRKMVDDPGSDDPLHHLPGPMGGSPTGSQPVVPLCGGGTISPLSIPLGTIQ